MKKKLFCLMIAVVMLLSGCCLRHEWVDADCDTPKTCAKCEKTEGEALGHNFMPDVCQRCGFAVHNWKDATCTAPKTCTVCAETEGEALGHSWQDATCAAPKTCTVCAETEGETLAHEVKWNFNRDEKTMNGDCSACGEHVEQELDWVLAADERIMGRWNARFVSKVGSNIVPLDSGYVEFYEDGTFEMMLADMTIGGNWSFDRVEDEIITAYIYKMEDVEGGIYWVIFMMDADNNFTMKLDELSFTFSKAA